MILLQIWLCMGLLAAAILLWDMRSYLLEFADWQMLCDVAKFMLLTTAMGPLSLWVIWQERKGNL